TLYDEINYCRSGFKAVADFVTKSLGAPNAEHIFNCLCQQFKSGNRKKTFNTALEELGIDYDEKFIGELVKVYRNHTPKITLPADSKDVLSQLKDKFTLALLTDGFLPAQKLKVQALDLEKYFKCIIYTEHLGRDCWKPSPAGFEKIIQTLNAKPQATCYVYLLRRR
ncbi:MAG: HAD family hydrolase, partial [Planctomycetota bacterium]